MGWQVIQFCVTCALGCAAWLIYPHTTNPYERLIFALAAGIGGMWLLMFLWVWLRYGWKAARRLSMDPG
jgi:hypothetical protein